MMDLLVIEIWINAFKTVLRKSNIDAVYQIFFPPEQMIYMSENIGFRFCRSDDFVTYEIKIRRILKTLFEILINVHAFLKPNK